MNLDPTQPIPPDNTTTPPLEVDQAGSAPRQGEDQDAQGKHRSRLTLETLKELAKWARRMKARNAHGGVA